MDNNSFSWARMSLLARYYMPAIKKHLTIYTVLIILYCLSSLLQGTTFWWSFIFVMFWGIMQLGFSYLFYLAPVAFSRYDDPVISTLLPAKGSEKAVFIIGYSLVFTPLFIYALLGIFTLIVNIFDLNSTVVNIFSGVNSNYWEDISGEIPAWLVYVNRYLGYLWMTAMTLYVVTVSRTNKLLKAILTTIIVPVATAVIGIIAGVIYSFNNKDSMLSTLERISEMGNNESEAAAAFVGTFLNELMIWIVRYQGLMTVIGIICVYLTWRKIVHNQV